MYISPADNYVARIYRIHFSALKKASDCLKRRLIPVSYTHLDVYKRQGEKKYTYRLSSCTCLAGDVIGDYSFAVSYTHLDVYKRQVGRLSSVKDLNKYSKASGSTFERCCVNADTDGVFLLKSKKSSTVSYTHLVKYIYGPLDGGRP